MEIFCRIFFLESIYFKNENLPYYYIFYAFVNFHGSGFLEPVMVEKQQGYGTSVRESSGLQENGAKI